MISNKTLRFLIKKLIWYVPIALLSIVLFSSKWIMVSEGFLLGVLVSIFKILIVGYFVCRTNIEGDKPTAFNTISVAMKFAGLLVLLSIVFFLSFRNGLDFFLAFATGTLLINLVILANSITEALSITNNKFE